MYKKAPLFFSASVHIRTIIQRLETEAHRCNRGLVFDDLDDGRESIHRRQDLLNSYFPTSYGKSIECSLSRTEENLILIHALSKAPLWKEFCRKPAQSPLQA